MNHKSNLQIQSIRPNHASIWRDGRVSVELLFVMSETTHLGDGSSKLSRVMRLVITMPADRTISRCCKTNGIVCCILSTTLGVILFFAEVIEIRRRRRRREKCAKQLRLFPFSIMNPKIEMKNIAKNTCSSEKKPIRFDCQSGLRFVIGVVSSSRCQTDVCCHELASCCLKDPNINIDSISRTSRWNSKNIVPFRHLSATKQDFHRLFHYSN